MRRAGKVERPPPWVYFSGHGSDVTHPGPERRTHGGGFHALISYATCRLRLPPILSLSLCLDRSISNTVPISRGSRVSNLSLCRGENRSIRFIGWSPLPIFLLEGEKRRRVIIARGTHWIPNRSDIRSKLDPILRYPRTESRNHGCHHVSLSPLAAMFSRTLGNLSLSLFHLSTFIITIPRLKG